MGKAKNYPEYLYVTHEEEGTDDHYFSAHETPVDAAEKGETVQYGVYKLMAVNDVQLRPNIRNVK